MEGRRQGVRHRRLGDGEPAFTFKVSEVAFEVLKSEPGLRPAPYLASRGMSWIQHHAAPGLDDDGLREHIARSHAIVAAGLPRRLRASWGWSLSPRPDVAPPPPPPHTPPMPDREEVLAVLDRIADPVSGQGLAQAGLVQGLVVGPDRAGFMLEVPAGEAERYAPVREAAEAALRALPGVRRVHVALTAHGDAAPPRPREVRMRRGAAPPPAPDAPPARPPSAQKPAHVRKVVAVASGKGGVGKSTVAVNLACAFAALGRRTGLLDADVYGPSAPKMMGITGEPPVGPDGKLRPVSAWGVAVASIGLLVDEGAPMIWRGPMASSAVGQLLTDVAWGSEAEPLDVLVVDMPPGTGDVQLTLAQRVAVDGAVIVSTPQEVALIDVRRGAEMFRKTATPILGVVENMAFFVDASGAQVPIFGRGGARRTAEALGCPFLGEVPIEPALREGGDAGRPATAADPGSPAARALLAAAAQVLEALDAGAGLKPPPAIVFE